MSALQAEVVSVDVDDTLIRSAGAKRIPMSSVAERVPALKDAGSTLYYWSTGGAEYAEANGACVVTLIPSTSAHRDTMNPKPIEQARTKELALALPALRRAKATCGGDRHRHQHGDRASRRRAGRSGETVLPARVAREIVRARGVAARDKYEPSGPRIRRCASLSR